MCTSREVPDRCRACHRRCRTKSGSNVKSPPIQQPALSGEQSVERTFGTDDRLASPTDSDVFAGYEIYEDSCRPCSERATEKRSCSNQRLAQGQCRTSWVHESSAKQPAAHARSRFVRPRHEQQCHPHCCLGIEGLCTSMFFCVPW